MYEYIDGNGNKYIIKNEDKLILEYIPIKPELSSSGVYSGGDYIRKEISRQELNKLESIFNQAVNKKEIHIKKRLKMSGMIIIQGINKKKTYIIGPNSKELSEIEKILRSMINTFTSF